MEKILGLDLGTNSIGWALRNTHTDKKNQIEKFGVVIFETGVGKDDKGSYTESYAALRTRKGVDGLIHLATSHCSIL